MLPGWGLGVRMIPGWDLMLPGWDLGSRIQCFRGQDASRMAFRGQDAPRMGFDAPRMGFRGQNSVL